MRERGRVTFAQDEASSASTACRRGGRGRRGGQAAAGREIAAAVLATSRGAGEPAMTLAPGGPVGRWPCRTPSSPVCAAAAPAAGLEFNEARRDSLACSVAERLRATGVRTVEGYLRWCRGRATSGSGCSTR
jgi:hypothetical protein